MNGITQGSEKYAGMGGELLAEYAQTGAAASPQKEYGYRHGQLLITATAGTSWGSPPVLHDNPLVVADTTVQSRHITELRDAIDALRTHLSMSAYSWQTAATPGDLIKADPLLEMRTALDQALGAPSPGYSAGLGQGLPIQAIHIQELRNRVLAAWSSGSSLEMNWLVADQLGTPRMIIDQSGSLANVKRHDYLPFGEELFAGTGGRTLAQGYTGDSVRQKFTQKERDNETGLDWFDSRYYSSVQGRFTSPDSYGGRLVNPQTLNLYSYVRNNPLKYVDPSGHRDEDPKKRGKKGENDDEFGNTPDTPQVEVINAEACKCGSPKKETGSKQVAEDILGSLNAFRQFTNQMLLGPIGAKGSDYAAQGFGVAQRYGNQAIYGPLAGTVDSVLSDPRVQLGLLVIPEPELEIDDLIEEQTFDQARRQAFDSAGMTDASTVKFSKVDPVTGTVVEFKGEGGAKVAYDGPHPGTQGPAHEVPHVGWRTAGKRPVGSVRGNIPYKGPQHPSRSPIKGQGVVDPH